LAREPVHSLLFPRHDRELVMYRLVTPSTRVEKAESVDLDLVFRVYFCPDLPERSEVSESGNRSNGSRQDFLTKLSR
jgi:hypothetical protein